MKLKAVTPSNARYPSPARARLPALIRRPTPATRDPHILLGALLVLTGVALILRKDKAAA